MVRGVDRMTVLTVGAGDRVGADGGDREALMGVEAAGEGGLVGRDAVCDIVRGAEGEGLCGAELTLGHGHLFEGNPVGDGTTRRGTDTPVHCPETRVGSTHSLKRGLRPPEQLERH